VEIVEHQQRSTELFGDSFNVGCTHVRAHQFDLLRIQPPTLQVIADLLQRLAVTPLKRQEHPRRTPVLLGFADDREVLLASGTAHLIDADHAHVGEARGLVCLGDVMEGDVPDPLGVLASCLGDIRRRHPRLRQNHHQ